MLDLHELNKFDKAGFDRNEIKWNGQMATALHSCGSQLGPCPCGCRLHAFTEERLTKGGLQGLLVRLAGFAKCGHILYPSYRHVHPDELALLNGMLPGYEWENPKMALCALGQLASPLQSGWLGLPAFVPYTLAAGKPCAWGSLYSETAKYSENVANTVANTCLAVFLSLCNFEARSEPILKAPWGKAVHIPQRASLPFV